MPSLVKNLFGAHLMQTLENQNEKKNDWRRRKIVAGGAAAESEWIIICQTGDVISMQVTDMIEAI